MNLTPKAYKNIITTVSELYPTLHKIEALLVQAQIPRGQINLMGPGINMWDSVLAYADRFNLHRQLLDTILKEEEENEALQIILNEILDGSAFMPSTPVSEVQSALPTSVGPAHIFFILEESDKTHYSKLRQQLMPLTMNGIIALDGNTLDILAGASFHDSINPKIANADIIVLMISGHFMGSDICLQTLFMAHELNKLIIPALMSPCLWARVKVLEHIQPLPLNGVPALQWALPDEAYMNIALGIEDVANHIVTQLKTGKV